MQAIGGLVTAGNLILSIVIVIRLLRLHSGGPERWLAAYFLFTNFCGTILASVVYMSWADPKLALPEGLSAPLNALNLGFSSLGLYGIWLFTQRVFRPEHPLALRAVRIAAAVLVISFAAVGIIEHFEVRIVNGPAYWLGYAAREGAMVWMAAESFLYWSRQRRRLRIGLADPIVVNRFLLWGIWASTVVLTMLADPGARLYYWYVTGSAETWVMDVGKPIIEIMIAVCSLLGALSASTLLLTFFPTAGYRRWIASRYATT